MTKVKIKNYPNAEKRVLANINKELKRLGDHELLVGVPDDAPDYPDGTSVVMVATVNEFGYSPLNIPERSFLRSTVHANRKKYLRKIKGRRMKGSKNTLDVLDSLGRMVKRDVRMKIKALDSPPLKRVRQDGTDNPLFHTKHLYNSIDYVVRKK